MPITLTVEDMREDRETVATGRRIDSSFAELGLGHTKHTLFVRTPGGRLFALNVPAEMYEELEWKAEPEPKPPEKPRPGTLVLKARRATDVADGTKDAREYTFKYKPEDYSKTEGSLFGGVPIQVNGLSSIRIDPRQFPPSNKGLLPFRIIERDNFCSSSGTLYPVAFIVHDFEWEDEPRTPGLFVGTRRQFAENGPKYEIIAVHDEYVDVELVDTYERFSRKLKDVLSDPEAT
jgi:hypothetical protein